MTTPTDERRVVAARAWQRWRDRHEARYGVREEIVLSWERSALSLRTDIAAAPLADETETATRFADSPLSVAVAALSADLTSLADDGDLVVAVSDPQTRILWTCGRGLRRTAERINFVAGGRWDEASVGTNALNLALRTNRVSEVFAAEHYAPIVHDWVCWAAPIHDVSGNLLGVLDLSTDCRHAQPIGAVTATALARLLEREIPETASRETGLRLRLSGTAQVHLDGAPLPLRRRQIEILALLALHPQGLTLGELHAHLYGDSPVTSGTLKAEVSHLRSVVGGRLGSRPYRLELPVTTDVDTIERAVAHGDPAAAAAAFHGDLVPGTASPYLLEMSHYLTVAVRECLLANPEPAAVLRYCETSPWDIDVIERALNALAAHPHPARHLLAARLAAAQDPT